MAKNPNPDNFARVYTAEWMEIKGLRQVDIIQKTGITPSQMSKMLNPAYNFNWDIEYINLVAHALGIAPYDLFRNPSQDVADEQKILYLEDFDENERKVIHTIISALKAKKET